MTAWWFHWLSWVVLNTVAVAFGYALASPVASAGQSVGLQVTDRTITMVMIVLLGLALAFAQWLLVRRQIDRAAIWLPVTFLGWAAPIFLVGAIFPPTEANQRMQIGAILISIGLTMGIAQYFVLRARKAHSAWWIPASALGWIILAITLPIPIPAEVDMLRIGAVPAMITGIAFALVVAVEAPIDAQRRAMNAT
jgi:hypothetical protein